MKTTSDDATLKLIKEVNKQKEEIAKLDKPNWKTNCSFSYKENSNDSLNLHVEPSVKKLVMIASFLRDKEESYNRTATELGVDAPAFDWDGFSVQDWVDDIQLRISKIQITSKKKKLEALETRLNNIISPELRAKLELESIQNELGL